MDSLKDKTIAGVGWATLAQGARHAVDLAAMVALARLLSPRDFGLLGMILVFTQFAVVFNEFGFGAALIQKKSIEERHLSSVFWLNVVTGVALAAIMVSVAPAVAWFYGEPRLEGPTRLISLNFLVGSLTIVPMALLTRAMNFKALAMVDIAAILVASTGAILLALAGWGFVSLVAQAVLLTTGRAILLWSVSRWRPRLAFDRRAIREILGFSTHMTGYQVFNYWMRNADYLLIGKYVNSAALGVYTWAYKIMSIPTSLTWVVQRVMFPALSRIQNDPERVKRIYLRTNALIGLLTVPLVCGLFVVARPFVLTFLGPNWEGVVPVLQILCFIAIKQPLGATTGCIYQSQGRTDLMLRWSVFSGILGVAGFALGVRWGAVGVATAYAITRYIVWYPAITVPGRLIGLSFAEFVWNVAGIFACAVAMATGVWMLGFALPPGWPVSLGLAVQVVSGIVLYTALVLAFKVDAARDARQLVAEQLTRATRSRPVTSQEPVGADGQEPPERVAVGVAEQGDSE